jgi:uncharacterized protein (TIGR00251 family)
MKKNIHDKPHIISSFTGSVKLENKNTLFLQEHPRGYQIYLKITAGAKSSEIIGFHENRLKMRLHASAVEGKANEELLRWWQKFLDVRKNQLEIISGEYQSFKTLLIQEMSQENIFLKLSPFLKKEPSHLGRI